MVDPGGGCMPPDPRPSLLYELNDLRVPVALEKGSFTQFLKSDLHSFSTRAIGVRSMYNEHTKAVENSRAQASASVALPPTEMTRKAARLAKMPSRTSG
jgi:hypothetical protein